MSGAVKRGAVKRGAAMNGVPINGAAAVAGRLFGGPSCPQVRHEDWRRGLDTGRIVITRFLGSGWSAPGSGRGLRCGRLEPSRSRAARPRDLSGNRCAEGFRDPCAEGLRDRAGERFYSRARHPHGDRHPARRTGRPPHRSGRRPLPRPYRPLAPRLRAGVHDHAVRSHPEDTR